MMRVLILFSLLFATCNCFSLIEYLIGAKNFTQEPSITKTCMEPKCKVTNSGKYSQSACTGEDCTSKCSGKFCKAKCAKGNCNSDCEGKQCDARAAGLSSKSRCTGKMCTSKCEGEKCDANCSGKMCYAECIGQDCTAVCTGKNCIKTGKKFVREDMQSQSHSGYISKIYNELKSLSADIFLKKRPS